MLIPGVALLTALLVSLAQPYPVPDTDTVYGNGLIFEAADGHHFTTHQQQGADLVLTDRRRRRLGRVRRGRRTGVRADRRSRPLQGHAHCHRRRSARQARRVRAGRVPRCAARALGSRDDAGRQPRHRPAMASTRAPARSWTPRSPSSPPRTSTFTGDTLLQNLADVVDRDQYWTSLTVDSSSGADTVAFTSGYGDGSYGSYWGFDDNNEVVCSRDRLSRVEWHDADSVMREARRGQDQPIT